MILSGEAIRERLNDGQIFRHGSWVEGSLKEASYALRIADDGLLINGEFYDPGVHFTETYIEIEPGKIAILSTKERLNMPNNLMGKIGIRFDQAAQGLTSLIGIQVDPLFGSDKDNERLFIRVANLGNESLKLLPGAEVFTFEVHEVTGKVRAPSPGKESTWLPGQSRLILVRGKIPGSSSSGSLTSPENGQLQHKGREFQRVGGLSITFKPQTRANVISD